MKTWRSPLWSGAWPALGGLVLGLSWPVGPSLQAQPPESTGKVISLTPALNQPAPADQSQADTAPVHSVFLQYSEQSTPIVSISPSFSVQAAPFAHEPELAGRAVVRGALSFGKGTEQALHLVWDFSRRKLYLDLNRNLDLTDDGAFSSSDRTAGGNYLYQTFTNVHVSIQTPKGERRLLVDLHFHRYNNTPGVTASCHSYWQGQLSLQGKEWQIGLVEPGYAVSQVNSAGGGYLLLRPWAEWQRPIDLNSGGLDGFGFCSTLFLQQRLYQVECAPAEQAGALGYRLELKEQPAQLGELRVSGKYIQRLVLTSGQGKRAAAVVLDTPGSLERIPLGRYTARLFLQQDGAGAHPQLDRSPGEGFAVVVISADSAAQFAAGGPLTNTVLVSRRGRDLYLSYKLLGARGDTYQLLGERRNPEFAIYQGEKKVASGKFEFG